MLKVLVAALVAVSFAVSAAQAAPSKKFGGGPGNSGPGDKNSQNEQGHGGQPTDR